MTKLNKHMVLGVTFLCLSALIAGASASEEMAEGMPEVLQFSSYMGEPGAEAHISEWPSQMAIVAAAEKYLGMPIEIEWVLLPPGDHRDRQAVYLASGDLHDVFSASGNVETINNLGELGQIINILDYEDELLYYKKWLGTENYNLERAGFDTGKVWGFAYGQASPDEGSQWVWAARMDTYETHDLQVPETLDELYDVLAALKGLYPDSYPMESYVAPQWYGIPRVIMLINRVDFGVYYDGSKYIYGPIDQEERFRQSIEYVARLYEEGLLQPEFFTQNPDDLPAKSLQDRTFMIPNQFALNVSNRHNNPEYPEVVWGVMPRPKGFDGQPGWKPNINKKGNNFIRVNAHINADFEHPALLVKLLDFAFSQEVIDYANWGIEGETYTVDSNGKKSWAPVIMDLTGADRSIKLAEWGAIGSGFGYPMLSLPTILDWEPRGQLWETPVAYGGGEFFKPASVFAWSDEFDGAPRAHEYAPPINLTQDELATVREIQGAVDTAVEEGMTKLITGQMSFDDWDAYIQGVKDTADYQRVVDIYNAHLN